MKNIRETQNGFLFCLAYQVILLLLVSLIHSPMTIRPLFLGILLRLATLVLLNTNPLSEF